MLKKVKSSKNVPQYTIEIVPENVKKDLTTCDEFITKEQVVQDGKVFEVLKKVVKDTADEIHKYKTSDFYMENLIACGAADSLRSVQYGDDDIDSVLSQLDSIEVKNNK